LNDKRKTFTVVIIAALLISGVSIALLSQPSKESVFVNNGENMMKAIDNPQVLNAIRANITAYFGGSNGTFTLQDLFEWQNKYLTYVATFPPSFTRSNDPRNILKAGIGKCQEFAILFTAACLSVGYEARLAFVVKNDFTDAPHSFCEVNIGGAWTQVDSSASAPKQLDMNNTAVYLQWPWWPLGTAYSIYDFDENNSYNITSSFI
jgi:hypothetical protein